LQYSKAPITEAIIDIQILREPKLTIEQLDAVTGRLSETFPVKKERKFFEGVMHFGPTPTTSSSQKQDGYVLIDANKKYVAQLHFDGLTVSVKPPYENWNTFKAEVKRLWNVFREDLTEWSYSRLAVRYINRIDVPLPIRDFRDYLRTYPELSSDMEPFVAGYFMQLQCPQPKFEASAVVTQGMIPPPTKDVISILLDIEVSKTINLPSTEEDLWNIFDQLRDIKNNIFEASITDRTRRLFE